jgi:hypothetical protein
VVCSYWLPHFLEHKHIALRFIPQESFEHSAPLTITPTPDVITRVFMLFKGVSCEDLGRWTNAIARAQESVDLWRDVVGIADLNRLGDKSLFRVLEWGGMEKK